MVKSRYSEDLTSGWLLSFVNPDLERKYAGHLADSSRTRVLVSAFISIIVSVGNLISDLVNQDDYREELCCVMSAKVVLGASMLIIACECFACLYLSSSRSLQGSNMETCVCGVCAFACVLIFGLSQRRVGWFLGEPIADRPRSDHFDTDSWLLMGIVLILVTVHVFCGVRTSRTWIVVITPTVMFPACSLGGIGPEGHLRTLSSAGLLASLSGIMWIGRFWHERNHRLLWLDCTRFESLLSLMNDFIIVVRDDGSLQYEEDFQEVFGKPLSLLAMCTDEEERERARRFLYELRTTPQKITLRLTSDSNSKDGIECNVYGCHDGMRKVLGVQVVGQVNWAMDTIEREPASWERGPNAINNHEVTTTIGVVNELLMDPGSVGLLFDGDATESLSLPSKHSSKQSYKSGEEGAVGLEQFEIPANNVEFANYYVGQGSQGKVRGGTFNKCRVAIKFFQAGPKGKTKSFRREANALLRLRHPHILLVMGIVSMPPSGFAIVSELCMGASLFYRLFNKQDINLRSALVIGTQVGSALAYLHGRRFQHRDVKASNVFLLNRSSQEPIAKLGDFASCRSSESGGQQTPGHTVGTPGYMAPEMARDEPYDQSADIFSFGLLLYELIAQQRAWSGQDIPHFGASGPAARVDEDNPKSMADLVPHLLEVSKLHVIPNLARLDDMLTGASALVEKCVSHDSAARPTASEAVSSLIHMEQNFHQL
jgi:hypothetical protein